ncbi:MAG: class I SAM-dependent RNA methyltransferase [Pseudomonadota bacterium]
MGQEFRIARLGARGDGVTEDGAVFVPFALPGERVHGDLELGDRVRFVQVLEPSPDRVMPQCPHFKQCGGCVLQHASDHLLAEWKAELIAASLASRGIEGVPVRPVQTVPAASRRRIAVTARRTRSGVLTGFLATGSGEIVPVSQCTVAAPELIAILPALEEIVRYGASRRGNLRLTLTLAAAGIDLAVTGAKALKPYEMALLAGMAARAGLARLAWNGEVAVTISPPVHRLGSATLLPPPGGFLQPTVEGEAALVAAVLEITEGAARVADLFSGSGTFTLPLAERAEVMAVDGEGPAIDALEAAWRATPGLRKVVAVHRDLFARPLRRDELKGLDAAVLDPPRAGARSQAEQLAEHGPRWIASVSCNPATFARDARILIDGGYRLDWVQPVDQFRWSAHVELVGAFRR